MKPDADKNILLKATLDTAAGAQGNKLPMSFYRQMCPQKLDDHDLKPGSYYPRILPSLPTTTRRFKNHGTTILYWETTLFCRTVMIVALCDYTCSLCNKLEMDGRRTGKPNNKYHHRQQRQQ